MNFTKFQVSSLFPCEQQSLWSFSVSSSPAQCEEGTLKKCEEIDGLNLAFAFCESSEGEGERERDGVGGNDMFSL